MLNIILRMAVVAGVLAFPHIELSGPARLALHEGGLQIIERITRAEYRPPTDEAINKLLDIESLNKLHEQYRAQMK